MKTCTKCGESKPITEFTRRPEVKSGRASHCKVCQRQWRTANRDKLLDQKKRYYDFNRGEIAERKKRNYDLNRDELLERQRARYAADPERYRGYGLRLRYGIGTDEYGALFAAQGGLCAICRAECPTGRKLAVDHNHKTGEVRGLLCANCNQGIGKFKENRELLLSAINYLKAEL